jgi:hypothetical protein
MDRTLNLVLFYILRLVSPSLSTDTEEHRQSLVLPNVAFYTLIIPSKRKTES